MRVSLPSPVGPLVVEAPFTANLLPKIEAAPWPYFPVDLLPCMIALGVRSEGAAMYWNKVYEGGFTWMSELAKFGAHVVVSDPHRITVFGAKPLRSATVEAPYIIRAAVALSPEAIEEAAAVHAPDKHVRMPSGAGHDAQVIGLKMPAAMMFVPSIGGISHHFTENTHDADIVLGCQVFADATAKILKGN